MEEIKEIKMKRSSMWVLGVFIIAGIYALLSDKGKAQVPITHSVTLSWSGATTGDVYKASNTTCSSATSFVKIASSVSVGTYTDPNLNPGETDCYWVLLSNNTPTNLIETTIPTPSVVKTIPALKDYLDAIAN